MFKRIPFLLLIICCTFGSLCVSATVKKDDAVKSLHDAQSEIILVLKKTNEVMKNATNAFNEVNQISREEKLRAERARKFASKTARGNAMGKPFAEKANEAVKELQTHLLNANIKATKALRDAKRANKKAQDAFNNINNIPNIGPKDTKDNEKVQKTDALDLTSSINNIQNEIRVSYNLIQKVKEAAEKAELSKYQAHITDLTASLQKSVDACEMYARQSIQKEAKARAMIGEMKKQLAAKKGYDANKIKAHISNSENALQKISEHVRISTNAFDKAKGINKNNFLSVSSKILQMNLSSAKDNVLATESAIDTVKKQVTITNNALHDITYAFQIIMNSKSEVI